MPPKRHHYFLGSFSVMARACGHRGRKWTQARFCVLLPVQGIGANVILCAVGVLLVLGSLLPFLRAFIVGAVNLPAFYPWHVLGAFCALSSLPVFQGGYIPRESVFTHAHAYAHMYVFF